MQLTIRNAIGVAQSTRAMCTEGCVALGKWPKTMPPLPVAALGYLAVDAGCSLAGVGWAFAFAFFFGLSAWRTFCTMRSIW